MINNQEGKMTNINTIQHNIDSNIQNFHRAEEMLYKTNDQRLKNQIMEKNQRRVDALSSMRKKINQ